MTDQELIEIANRYGRPIVMIPIDNLAEQRRDIATVDLTVTPPTVTRRPARPPGEARAGCGKDIGRGRLGGLVG
jgi:hypothetical protein